MSVAPYPEYKDSGVEWIGSIPRHWAVGRFKHLFRERDARSDDGAETLLSVSAYTGVTPRSDIIDSDEHLTRAESLVGYKIVQPDDLVINIMLAWNRGLGVSNYHGIVSPAYAVFQPLGALLPTYAHYALRSDEYIKYFKAYSTGVIDSRLRIYPEVFLGLKCALPPIPDQSAIAAFLDQETGKIDALVAEQERLIALLKEKRQAVISQAVTKGLNPNAPMKDSGIEWLGQVPAHWRVGKLGHFCNLRSGFAFAAESFGADGVAVVRMNNLKRGRLELAEAARIPEKDCVEAASLAEGDLVWGMSGSTGETGSLGNYARVSADDLPCQLNQRVGRFETRDGALDTDFLELLIQTNYFYEQIMLFVTGTAQYNVSSGQVQSCIVALPPINQQRQLTAFAKEQLARFDTLITEATQAITLLRERRAALISAAVTGKIDVRSLTPTKQEAA